MAKAVAAFLGSSAVSHVLIPRWQIREEATRAAHVEEYRCLNVQLRYHLCMPPSDHPLHGVDLRLLRIFQAVVRFNGFSAAQEPLGITQATISAHMKQLEGRLGLRLCERGRSGFYLTDYGKNAHRKAAPESPKKKESEGGASSKAESGDGKKSSGDAAKSSSSGGSSSGGTSGGGSGAGGTKE